MKTRILLALLIITSLMGYLAWGKDQHSFLAEVEWKIIRLTFSDPKSIIHPFVLIPMAGQLLLLISIFRQKPNMWLIYSGMGCIGLLLGFMLFIGILALNFYIILSTLPFLTCAALTIIELKRQKSIK